MSGRSADRRAGILGDVRRALGRGPVDAETRAALDAHLCERPRGPVPARSRRPHAELVDLFVGMAEEAAATVERLSGTSGIPGAVASYLQARNLPAEVRLAPDPALTGLDWAAGAPMLSVSDGPADGGMTVSVTRAFAGIAETGTLMLTSGAHAPTTLNFLPETHIVVLPAEAVVGPYEDAWARLRADGGEDDGWPRTVNLITGPSRTGDIEQTIQLGAHGPRRLHILVVDDGR